MSWVQHRVSLAKAVHISTDSDGITVEVFDEAGHAVVVARCLAERGLTLRTYRHSVMVDASKLGDIVAILGIAKDGEEGRGD